MSGAGPNYWFFGAVMFAAFGIFEIGTEVNRFNILASLICLATHSILAGRR